MPKFKQFINVQPPDYGAALKVSGFFVSNEADSAPLQEPFPYNAALPLFSSGSGINSSVRVASGEFFVGNPLLKWNLVNPSDGSVFSPDDLHSLSAFEGFEVNLKSQTGQLINIFSSGDSKDPELQLDNSELLTLFSFYDQQPNSEDSNDVGINKRQFQVEVISTDYYGRKDTGICYLNAKISFYHLI